MAWPRRLDANVSLQLTSIRFNLAYLSELLGDPKRFASLGLARIKEIVADTTPKFMREREIKGKKGSPTLNFIGPAKAGNWKQLQSEDDAVSILEEFAHDAMQLGGYL
jgi:hypothetical protein